MLESALDVLTVTGCVAFCLRLLLNLRGDYISAWEWESRLCQAEGGTISIGNVTCEACSENQDSLFCLLLSNKNKKLGLLTPAPVLSCLFFFFLCLASLFPASLLRHYWAQKYYQWQGEIGPMRADDWKSVNNLNTLKDTHHIDDSHTDKQEPTQMLFPFEKRLPFSFSSHQFYLQKQRGPQESFISLCVWTVFYWHILGRLSSDSCW